MPVGSTTPTNLEASPLISDHFHRGTVSGIRSVSRSPKLGLSLSKTRLDTTLLSSATFPSFPPDDSFDSHSPSPLQLANFREVDLVEF